MTCLWSAPSKYQAYALTEYYGEVPAMLEFRFKTGNVLAIAYFGLAKAFIDLSHGIVIHYHSGPIMTLSGRNRSSLYTAINAHRVCGCRRRMSRRCGSSGLMLWWWRGLE